MNDLHRPDARGILYAEDFGVPEAGPAAPGPACPEPPPPVDLEEACRVAVEAARADWAGAAEQRRAEALVSLAAGLGALQAAASVQAEAVAEGIARTALGVVRASLPHLCRQHGDAEVTVLVRRLLPLLAGGGGVVVRVHSGLLDALRTDVDRLDEALAGRIELRPANLQPGDVQLAWEDGTLARDAGAIRAAVADGLAALGLLGPDATLGGIPGGISGGVPGAALAIDHRSLALAQ